MALGNYFTRILHFTFYKVYKLIKLNHIIKFNCYLFKNEKDHPKMTFFSIRYAA